MRNFGFRGSEKTKPIQTQFIHKGTNPIFHQHRGLVANQRPPAVVAGVDISGIEYLLRNSLDYSALRGSFYAGLVYFTN
jgi:hypothetical protein